MSQIKLITKANFTEDTIFLPSSLKDERFNASIDAAQNVNLKPLLGVKMFSDLLLNKTAPKYVKLLEGDVYVDSDGDSIVYPGLIYALCHWTMAHYYPRAQNVETSHSIVTKLSQHSEPISSKEISRSVSDFLAIGSSYFNEDVKKYICEHKTDFPLYSFHICNTSPNTGPVTISAIGGDD